MGWRGSISSGETDWEFYGVVPESPQPRSNIGAGLPCNRHEPRTHSRRQPRIRSRLLAACARVWPTMGDACMSPGTKLEVELCRLEKVEGRGLLPPDAAAKARDALVAASIKSVFTAGNFASGGGGGGVDPTPP